MLEVIIVGVVVAAVAFFVGVLAATRHSEDEQPPKPPEFDPGKPYVMKPNKTEKVVGEYKFTLLWVEEGYYYASVMDGYRVVHSMVTESLKDVESWLAERAEFLNKTTYTVNKALSR